jgi:hypothetical protein
MDIVSQEIATKEGWIEGLPRPMILEVLYTYIMPSVINSNPDSYNWVNVSYHRTQDLLDNPLFAINKDKLIKDNKLIGKTSINDKYMGYLNYGNTNQSININSQVCELTWAYLDHFKFVSSGRILRNFLVYLVEDSIIIGCVPNLNYTRIGDEKVCKNPLIWMVYEKQKNNNIGTSPTFDSIDLAKVVNILTNYMLETLATKGNKIAVDDSLIDIKTQAGGAGQIYHYDGMAANNRGIADIRQALMPLPDNNDDIASIYSGIREVKSEAQEVASATNSFNSSIQRQTATEIASLVNQSNSIVDAVVKRVIKYFTEMYSRMLDDLCNRGIIVQGIVSETGNSFDFSAIKNKKFVPKITATNPQLTKQLQLQALKELLTMALQSQNSEILARINISETAQEIFRLADLNKPSLCRDDMQAQQKEFEINEEKKIYAMFQAGMLMPNPIAMAQAQQQQQQGQPQAQQQQGNTNAAAS